MAKIPHKTLLAACEAIDSKHCDNGNNAETTKNAKNNRDEDKTEHFTVLLSDVNVFSLTYYGIAPD